MKKAEITVFLSLIFILLVTFTGSVIESASIQVAKNYRRSDAVRAMECVFAEYQKELLEEYDLFGLDAGYETGEYEKELLDRRLEYYGLVNSANTIERIQFLSDGGGSVFCDQVSLYMRHRYGLDYVKDKLAKTGQWKSQSDKIKDYEKAERQNSQKLENIFKNSGIQLSDQNNPKQTPVLRLVMPKGTSVSEKKIVLNELPSYRELQQGYGDFSKENHSFGTVDKLLLGEYLLEHFHSATDQTGNVLDYEIEYLIAGKNSDRENLKTVANRLVMMRFVPNYAYLQGNTQKQAKAQTIALTLCTLLMIPEAAEVVAQGILLAWAYEDAIEDVKALLGGRKVSFSKQGKDSLGYEDYLRILLFLGKKEETAMRAMDLIEQNLKKIQGQEFFRVDNCITKLEIRCRCSFRRGIHYMFPVYFGYQ